MHLTLNEHDDDDDDDDDDELKVLSEFVNTLKYSIYCDTR